MMADLSDLGISKKARNADWLTYFNSNAGGDSGNGFLDEIVGLLIDRDLTSYSALATSDGTHITVENITYGHKVTQNDVTGVGYGYQCLGDSQLTTITTDDLHSANAIEIRPDAKTATNGLTVDTSATFLRLSTGQANGFTIPDNVTIQTVAITATGISNLGSDLNLKSDNNSVIIMPDSGNATEFLDITRVGANGCMIASESGGTDVLYLQSSGTYIDNSDNMTIAGDLTVTGNDIKGSAGAVISFSGTESVFVDSITVAGDITTIFDIYSDTLTTTGAITGPNSIETKACVVGGIAATTTVTTTRCTSDGDGADNISLADGVAGQIKNFVFMTEAAGGDTVIITPANFGGGTTVTMNAVGDGCGFVFDGTNWQLISNNGCTVA